MGRPLPLAPPPCPSTHIPPGVSWGIPVVAVALFTVFHGFMTLRLFGKKKRRLVIELAFVMNLAIESGVAMRVQFNHDFSVIQANCILTLVSSSLALLCMGWYTYEKYKNVVPMRRWRYIFRHLFTWGFAIQLMQLAFRGGEAHVRFNVPRDGSSSIPVSVIESDFSVVPLVLGFATWISRVVGIKEKVVDTVNVIVLGGVAAEQRAQGGVPVASTLSNGLLRLNHNYNDNNNPAFYNVRSFDVWSTTVATNDIRNITLNMWEMRHCEDHVATSWRIPPVDFILLRFSLVNRDSHGAIRLFWADFLRERAPDVRIILIGTDHATRDGYVANNPNNVGFVTRAEGKRLALEVGAVAYEECDIPNEIDRQSLVTKFVKLMM